MSSIATGSSAYYLLANLSSGNTGMQTAQTDSPTSTLLQALSAASTAGTSNNSAYTLDLSSAAQNYLGGTGSAASGFTLTDKQQQSLTAILTKYKDAPQTQATFDAIQNDLNAAGLGANQLAQADQIKNFNGTQLLIDDLSGNYQSADPLGGTSSDEQGKSSAYMQQVISQWQSIATKAAPATGSDAPTSLTA